MNDAQWFWWASTDGESYHVGPCDSRDEVIETAIDDELGLSDADGRWVATFHIVEARQDPMMIKDWIRCDELLERADEAFFDSEFCGEDQDAPFFEATVDQQNDLFARIKSACDDWQAAHGLAFKPWAFTAQRNAETIARDFGPVEETSK